MGKTFKRNSKYNNWQKKSHLSGARFSKRINNYCSGNSNSHGSFDMARATRIAEEILASE